MPLFEQIMQKTKPKKKNPKKQQQQLFVAFPWVETSTGPGGFMICVFII